MMVTSSTISMFGPEVILSALACDKPHCECYRALKRGAGKTHCPNHHDPRPSLDVAVAPDGRLLVHCFAGCPQEQVIAALRQRGLWLRTAECQQPCETRYELRDPDGRLVAVHIRRDKRDGSKECLWAQPDGSWGLGGRRIADLPLYGVHRLGDEPAVIVCEGEKATEALIRLGLPAVGTVTGANATPGDNALRPLVERTVYLWADNDAAGRAHMARIAERLMALGASDLRWIEWSAAPPKGDAADLIAAGGTADDVRRLMEEARPWTLAREPAPQPAAASDGEERPNERRSQAARALDLIKTLGIELWHTPDDEPWATIPVGDHREHWPIHSRAFRTWLQYQFYARYGELVHHQALGDALDALVGRALFEGPEHATSVRIAAAEGAVYLDLGDAHWRAITITPVGWDIVRDPPVRFRRPRRLQPLPVPVRGGSLERLWRFVRVEPANRPLILAWLLMIFRPRGPYPVLALVGEQGSGKSTTARVLRRLVDPNDADLRAEPREERDLWVAAVNGWLLALDNVSRLPGWLSDALCRIATGAGFAARTLYANTEETILAAQRPVLITSIADVIAQPDLLDRALVLTLPRLPDDAREPEGEFWGAFDAERPALLGALLDGVARALAREQHVRLPGYPRMADFVRWAVAALGDELSEQFLMRYMENRREAGITTLEASLLAAAIIALMETTGEWQGTAHDLLDELDAQADEETRRKRERTRAWPKTPRGLAGELRRLAPALRQHGIAIEFARTGHERQRIILLMREHGGTEPSASSAGAIASRPDAESRADGWRTIADDCGRLPNSNRLQQNGHADADFSDRQTVADGTDGRFGVMRANGVTPTMMGHPTRSRDRVGTPITPNDAALRTEPADDDALAERVLDVLHELGAMYAARVSELLDIPFVTLKPILQQLTEQGAIVVQQPGAPMAHTIVAPRDEGCRSRADGSDETLWR